MTSRIQRASAAALALALTFSTQLSLGACALRPLARQAPTPQCALSSVCFAIDQSDSLPASSYTAQLQLVENVTALLEPLTASPTFSLVGFSDLSTTLLPATTSVTDFVAALMASERQGGLSNPHAGMSSCFAEVAAAAPGTRLIVLLSAGTSSTGSDPQLLAESLNSLPETGIVTIGLGPQADGDALRTLAKVDAWYFEAEADDLPGVAPAVTNTLCGVVGGQDACAEAFQVCDFKFAGKDGLRWFDMGTSGGEAFTTRVVAKETEDGEVGVLDSGGIVPEFVFGNGDVRLVTEYGTPPFSKDQFKAVVMEGKGGSGIGREDFRGNQREVAEEKCLRIYFTGYQTMSDSGVVMGNETNVTKNLNKCVAFRMI